MVERDAVAKFEAREHLGGDGEHFEVCPGAPRSDQFAAELPPLPPPLDVRPRPLAEDRRGVAEAQGALFGCEQSRGGARHRGGHVGPQREQTPVRVREAEAAARLLAPHATLEQDVVVHGGRRDLLVAPAVEDTHHRVLDRAPQTRLTPEVVAHPAGNF